MAREARRWQGVLESLRRATCAVPRGQPASAARLPGESAQVGPQQLADRTPREPVETGDRGWHLVLGEPPAGESSSVSVTELPGSRTTNAALRLHRPRGGCGPKRVRGRAARCGARSAPWARRPQDEGTLVRCQAAIDRGKDGSTLADREERLEERAMVRAKPGDAITTDNPEATEAARQSADALGQLGPDAHRAAASASLSSGPRVIAHHAGGRAHGRMGDGSGATARQ